MFQHCFFLCVSICQQTFAYMSDIHSLPQLERQSQGHRPSRLSTAIHWITSQSASATVFPTPAAVGILQGLRRPHLRAEAAAEA